MASRKVAISNPIPSNRRYIIAYIQGNQSFTFKISLEWILNEDLEAAYALYDCFDSILDMKPGEYRHMSFCRDSVSPGTIARTD